MRCVGLTTGLFALLTVAGCAASGPAGPTTRPALGHRPDLDKVRAAALDMADTYVIQATQAYDDLIERTTRPQVARWAVEQKIATATAAFTNATNPNPYVGVVDLVILAALKRTAIERHWVPTLLGDGEGSPVLAAARRAEADAWAVAGRVLSGEQVRDLRHAIDAWVAAHPDQHYVALVRLTDFAGRGQSGGSGGAGGIDIRLPPSLFGMLYIDPLAGLDPVAQEMRSYRWLTERLVYLGMRMPGIWSWQVRNILTDATDTPQTRRFVDATSRFADATTKFADATAAFPRALSVERQAALQQAGTFLTAERAAAIAQAAGVVAAERSAAIRQAGDELASHERRLTDLLAGARATLADVQASAASLDGTLRTADRTIGSAKGGVLAILVVAIAGPAVALLLLRLVDRVLPRTGTPARHRSSGVQGERTASEGGRT